MLIESLLRRAYAAWLTFWFPAPAPQGTLALLRIGTALLLIYVLFVRSFDLDTPFSRAVWADPETLHQLDPIAWPFSLFGWSESTVWMWTLHGLAMLVAMAFLLGVLTPLAAALSLLLQLSYAHQNPAMLLGVDGLLILALAYLSLVSSGRVLGVFARDTPGTPEYPPYLSYLKDEQTRGGAGDWPWSGLPLRLLQLHLSLLYLHSALAKLTTDWVAGTALWHPRGLPGGALYGFETLHAAPYLAGTVATGLLLFELLYAVLIWVRPLRYPLLVLALGVHLGVGFTWNLVPFNLLLLVLNLVFVPVAHVEAMVRFIRPLLVLPWVVNDREG